MSLIIFKEPEPLRKFGGGDLPPGTWFVGEDNQVFVVVVDDRTHEKRVLCVGHFYKPFITNMPLSSFLVRRILETGTLLQVTCSLKDGGQDDQ